MKKLLSAVSIVALLASSGLAFADDMGALITFAAQVAGTVNAPTQNNSRLQAKTVLCTFNQASHHSGTGPSTTFAIEGYDAASASWYDLIRSSAVTNDATPTTIAAGVGVATASNIGVGLPVPANWRVSATIGGTSTPDITGTIGCNRTF